LLEAVRPIFAEARADVVATHQVVQQVLTTEQWSQLPEDVRNLRARLSGAGRQDR